MERFFFLFLLVSSFLFSSSPSDPQELALMEGDPSAIVYGCVNALTGDLIFEQQDCIVKGAEPIFLPRRYVSAETKHPHLRWNILNHSTAMVEVDASIRVYIPESSGITLVYFPNKDDIKSDGKKRTFTTPLELHPHPQQFRAGIVHRQGSHYYPLSNKVRLHEDRLFVEHADGSFRCYKFSRKTTKPLDPLAITTKTKSILLLDHEKLPNGNTIYYKWQKYKKIPVIEKIETFSPQNVSLASARVCFNKNDKIHVETSDIHLLKYKYETFAKKLLLTRAITSEYPEETRKYDKKHRLKQKIFPNGRTLKIKYNDEGQVVTLLGPDGPLCHFSYSPGHTHVVDRDGHVTDYFFDPKTFRLSKVETLTKKETLIWDEEGNLLSKEIRADVPVLTLDYQYDKKANLVSKTLQGVITKEGIQDKYTTRYVYDENNHLIEEREDSGLITTYTYLEKTNLPTSKILMKEGSILKRTFYEYDEDHLLIKEIEDDGPNYSERHIKKIHPRKEAPFYGLPKSIEEYFLDKKKEILKRKTVLNYDHHGNVVSKAIFDSKGNFQYKEETLYNDKGQIEKKIDPEKNVTAYQYDSCGNLILEISPLGLKTVYVYNQPNHLCSKTEGNYRTLYKDHTLQGKPQKIIDPLKGVTTLEYDDQGNLCKKTDPTNQITTYEYNSLGHLKAQTDPLGNTTHIVSNIYGSPLKITHPDGTIESFTYRIDGKKATYTDQNGTTTYYTYDLFGNLIKEEVVHDGQVLYLVQKLYNTFHLLEEIDSEGVKTKYVYAPSGELKKKMQGKQAVSYVYDSLGRCTKESSDEVSIEKTYDFLNRVIKEKKYIRKKLLSQKEYTYDPLSNILTETSYPNNTQAITRYSYDIFGREIEKENPLGEKTKTRYVLEDTVEKKIVTQPEDIEIIETTNQLNQIIKIKKKTHAQTIQKADLKYDPNGNLIEYATTVYRGYFPHSEHLVTYTYDQKNRKISETENSIKTTRYTYTKKGEVATLTKPDQTTLLFSYNPLGHLINLCSDDQTIAYSFVRNTRGELLSSIDHIHQTQTIRSLDIFGNILEENLANGFTLKNTYDHFHRRTILELPHLKPIHYKYKGSNLSEVSYQDVFHKYSLDLEENPIGEQTFNRLFIKRTFDPLSRPLTFSANSFKQKCLYNSRGNLIEIEKDGEIQTYGYDFQDHLIEEPGYEYCYDSMHNRTFKNSSPYSVNALNQIEEGENEIYRFDLNGNLIQKGEIFFAYDALDRLIKVTTPEGEYFYTYDSENRRLSRNEEKFIWDGQHELGTTDCLRILGRTTHAEIGATIAILLNGTLYVPIHDLQGNLTHLFDHNKQQCTKQTFSAFGEGTPTLAWGFSSKRHDPETSFVYFGRRYYDPSLGRFITADPEGYTNGYNLYAYCGNNPLTHVDPYGLHPFYYMQRPSLEEMNEMIKGFAHGVAQWTVDTALTLKTGMGGMYGTEDMSVLEMYNIHDRIDQKHIQGASNWFQNTLGVDPQSSFYQMGYKTSYFTTDFAMGMLIPGGNALKGGKVLSTIKNLKEAGNVAKITNLARKYFPSYRHKKVDLDALSKAGQAMDRQGLTKAGRGLDKHGNRPETVFPKARGNIASKNMQGQFQLDDILTHPKSFIEHKFKKRYNYYFDIRIPGDRGVRFSEKKEFLCFLEPN